MGKKLKKGAGRPRNVEKGKKFQPSSPDTVLPEIVPDTETVVNDVSVVKVTQTCPHIKEGINFEKFSVKISSLESLKCDDCRDSGASRKPKKAKAKAGKNKGSGSKSVSSSIWVCLDCGNFSCGGVGFPTTPQTHAARHSKQYRHPLVIQFSNPNLRWCFRCNTLIPVQHFENEEHKDSLSEFIKLIKTPAPSETRFDVEDIWFGNGSVISGIPSVSSPTTFEIGDGHMVRGLVNLGNTCFFNSVLQNLLAMDKLRDYFIKLEGPAGPLTSSLKKLFVETAPSSGVRNVINPRSFFGCVCTKAPQFKGFQQHDSHELLRCLLDGLCTEESRIRKRTQDGKSSPEDTPTFVDKIFGGQISSTVSCLECGHASVVYEPCLDLSLPLPTKSSQSKRFTSVSRSKKPKPPPKRQGKFRPKGKKTTNISTSDGPLEPTKIIDKCIDTNIASGDTTPSGLQTNEIKQISDCDTTPSELPTNGIKQISDCNDISSDNLVQLVDTEPTTLSNSHDNGNVNSTNVSSLLDHDEHTMVSNGHDTTVDQVNSIASEEEASWLDYLEPSSSTVQYTTLYYQDSSLVEDFGYCNDVVTDTGNSNDVVQDSGTSNDVIQDSGTNNAVFQDSGSTNDVVWEDEPLLKVQESEVLILPYNEVTSTVVQETLEFDLFGGMFDEPEPELAYGPAVNPLSNGIEESDSDPGEVDDTDSPVSVEKCLAYFTTPELLTKTEHAWQCEKCSKSLLEQKTRLKNNLQKSIPNGAENGVSCVSSDSCIEHVQSNGFRNVSDESTESAGLASDNGNLDNGKSDDGQGKSDSSEDDEVDSKQVMVARDASKRILISRVPPVLTIHLKRFCQDARGRLSKLNGHVTFRDTIDLKTYMDPSCCKDGETYKYQLVGVVEHSGTMRGGHYVAYVKGVAKGNLDKSLWYHASDAYIREASIEEVFGCEAYILFYEQV